MSVLMILRVPASADALARAAEENREMFLGIAERAKARGAIHHDFYEGDGEFLVVDEWESPEAFQGFFEDEAQNIGQLLAAAGVQGEPGPPSFHRKLSLGDEF
jgi:heme-degrading monooxygenase HmoA